MYDAAAHVLNRVVEGDFRSYAGTQEYTHCAPITVIYAADLNKSLAGSLEDKKMYATVDAGFIGQNVYLFAASRDLAVVFRGSIDRSGLAEILKLTASQMVLFAQSVGFMDEEKLNSAPIHLKRE